MLHDNIHDIHHPFDWKVDIMLTDIQSDDLEFVATKLGLKYLSAAIANSHLHFLCVVLFKAVSLCVLS
ncbi:hypothetical protein EON65_21295 [archaeon]|nr:MAG: hypothetical protein EON65_21295 [archaeon]